MTKMTYVSALDVAINAVSDDAVKEKLTALRAQIEKDVEAAGSWLARHPIS